jgi:hypothetical protein
MSSQAAAVMLEDLPDPVRRATAGLFEVLPLSEAMPDLVPKSTASKEAHRYAAGAESELASPALKAGIWLYVDDLDRSHAISQGIADPTGSMWHAILHRREGDFSNAKYWLRGAGNHPALKAIEGYDPMDFVDEVARRHDQNPAELVELQRREWAALFRWCANAQREA